MPLLYTHIRFANKCIDLLQDEYKEIIKNNYLFFLYGTQGPNILNYHSPFTNKKYKEISDTIHNNQIANTLNTIKKEFKGNKNRDSVLAYSFGYVSHYLFDSYTKSYLIESSKVINTDISSLKNEIERHYLQKDGINFNSKIYKNSKIANTIISKILNIPEKDIKQSISNMSLYTKIIYTKNKSILNIFKILHLNKYLSYFVYSNNSNHPAQILRIIKYFEISKYHYQILAQNYIDFIFNHEPLNDYFFNPFTYKNNTSILDFNEEKKYIIKDYNK